MYRCGLAAAFRAEIQGIVADAHGKPETASSSMEARFLIMVFCVLLFLRATI